MISLWITGMFTNNYGSIGRNTSKTKSSTQSGRKRSQSNDISKKVVLAFEEKMYWIIRFISMLNTKIVYGLRKPKISIVTPCFNMVDYLEETIDSVLSQQYPELEYIVIDGGSNDGSVDIIKKYKKYLTYWVSEKDHGMYDAIQKGFDKSSGEIMGWVNSDDLLHKGSLYILAEIFTKFSKVSWLTATPCYADEQGRFVGCREVGLWSKYRFYTGDFQWIQQESTFWQRSLWDKAGSKLRTDLQYAGDFELWLRFFRHAKLYSSNALIGAFRGRKENQKSSEGLEDYIEEAISLLNEEKRILNNVEKRKVQMLTIMNKLFFGLPVLGNLHKVKKLKMKMMEMPSRIYFDRDKQSFYLAKI